MNDIHHHSDTESMSLIHKGLEFLRCTETRTQSEEICHLITERAVIRMLLKSHDLKCVISQIRYLRQDIQTEFLECSDLLLFRRHTDMALIDKRMRTFSRLSMLPFIRLRIPHLSAECLCMRILHRPGYICRDSLSTTARPFYIQLVQSAMIKEHRRQDKFPVTASDRLKGIRLGALPVVELADHIYLGGVRSPLTEHPVARSITMKAIIRMIVHSPAEGTIHRKPVLQVKNHLVSSVNDILVRFQPLVVVINHLSLLFCAHIFLLLIIR